LIVQGAVPKLRPALCGDPLAIQELDQTTFILTANHLYEELTKEPDRVIRFDSVLDTYQNLSDLEVSKCVARLVQLNLLTYLDDRSMKIHTRRLSAAYTDLLRNDPAVKNAVAIHKALLYWLNPLKRMMSWLLKKK